MFFVFKGHLSPFWRLCGGTQDEPTDQDTVPPLIVRIGWILLGRTVSFVLFQVLHGVVNRWTEMRMLDDCADDYLVLIYQEEVRMQNSLETFNWEFDLSLAVEIVRWNDKEKKKHFPNIRNEVTLILDDSILPVTETYFFIISVCILDGELKKLPGLEMTILWRVRWRSRDTNIPAVDLILLHAERGPCSYAENWERSQGKPVWINPMQSALLGKRSHPEWVSQVKWKRRAQCLGELSQQKGKHMECSRNLKCLPMDRAMHTVSCKTSVGPSWRLWWAVLTVSHHFIRQTTWNHGKGVSWTT